MRKILLICCMLLSWSACAQDVDGVNLPETLRLGGRDLVLNGAGVRTRFFFDLYVAALYLDQKKNSSDVILSEGGASRVSLHLLRDISGETLLGMFFKAIYRNLSPSELAAVDPQLKQFSAYFSMMGEAKEGDVLTMDYLPGKGTEINFNDVNIGVIEGVAFNNALLRVWLGKKPAQESLKKELLGG